MGPAKCCQNNLIVVWAFYRPNITLKKVVILKIIRQFGSPYHSPFAKLRIFLKKIHVFFVHFFSPMVQFVVKNENFGTKKPNFWKKCNVWTKSVIFEKNRWTDFKLLKIKWSELNFLCIELLPSNQAAFKAVVTAAT